MQLETPAAATLSYTFSWDRKEFVRFYRALHRHARLGAINRIILRGVGVCAAGAVLLIVFLLATGRHEAASAAFPWTLIVLFWASMFRLLAPRSAAKQWEKQNCCAAHPMTRELSADGLRVLCPMRDTRLRWEGIQRAVETQAFFLFFQNDRCALYLPKRAVSGPGELQRVRDLVIRHTPLTAEKGVG